MTRFGTILFIEILNCMLPLIFYSTSTYYIMSVLTLRLKARMQTYQRSTR